MMFKIIKSVMLVCVLCLVCEAQSAVYRIDRLVAVVGSKPITESEIRDFKRLYRFRAQMDPFLKMSGLTEKSSDADVLNYLIEERLIADETLVSETMIEQEIEYTAQSNGLKKENLIEVIGHQGGTYEDFKDIKRKNLERKSFFDKELRNKIVVTESDIKNYYFNTMVKDTNKTLEYKIAHILLVPSKYESKDLLNKKIKQIKDALKAGEPFEDVAKKYSDDSNTSQSGGDLGYFDFKSLHKETSSALKTMKIYDVSDAISSSIGIQFVKLLDIKTTDDGDYKKEERKISEILSEQATAEHMKLWLENKKQTVFLQTTIQ